MRLILYTKPGCHLCEGLQEKLEQIRGLSFELEIRDITTREDWFQAYQYKVPVLGREASARSSSSSDTSTKPAEEQLPRPSPRTTVQQLEQMLQKYIITNDSQ